MTVMFMFILGPLFAVGLLALKNRVRIQQWIRRLMGSSS